MSFRNILTNSIFTATAVFSFTLNASATWKYSVGIGYGIGLIKFNDNKEHSTFYGNIKPELTGTSEVINNGNKVQVPNNILLTQLGASNPALRTTYKYVENLPQRILHLELGATKSFENINLINRNLFAGVMAGFGFGKVNASKGITNPNGRYMSTGSTALFWSLNGKFGLENETSKIYGILGLTYAKVDLPYDILPFGTNAKLGDLNTQVVMQEGSALLESVGNSGLVNLNATTTVTPIETIASINQQTSAKIKVKDASTSLWFINIGAGLEVNMTKQLVVFAEYTHLMQLNRGGNHSIKYTVDGKEGAFKGVIHSTNSDYLKAGMRYYFN